MDLTLSEDQRMLADTAAAFVSRDCPRGRVRAVEAAADMHDAALWRAMADLGWCGLALPAEHGGFGQGLLEVAVLADQLGRGPVPSPLLGSTLAARHCPARLLPALASGERIATIAVVAPALSGGPRLSGTTLVVPWAAVADVLVVATTDGLALVEPARGGVSVERHDAFAGEPLYAVTFDDAPAEPLGGPDALGRLLDEAAVVHLAYAVGAAEGCLDLALRHALQREQFGRPIGAFQAVAHRCVDMRADIDACRYLSYEAAWALDGDGDATLSVPAALTFAADAVRRVFLHAHQVHGAVGFSTEHDLHLLTRRLKEFEVTYASAPRHRDSLAIAMGLR